MIEFRVEVRRSTKPSRIFLTMYAEYPNGIAWNFETVPMHSVIRRETLTARHVVNVTPMQQVRHLYSLAIFAAY